MLSQLKPSEVMTDFVFKDRLFASLSNYAAAVCSHDNIGVIGANMGGGTGGAPTAINGQVTMW